MCLNSSNLVQGSNNCTFKYNFIGGNFTVKDCEICISTASIPYAFYNITQAYGNNLFSVNFPVAGSGVFQTQTQVIPDGFYSVNDIQNLIQAMCITYGWYLIDSAGNFAYFINIAYDTALYKIQLITTLVPTSLPSGYTEPVLSSLGAAWQGYPVTAATPQLVLPTGSIAPIIGFSTGTFPTSTASNSNTLSSLTPIGSTVNSLVMRCSLVDNSITMPSDIMDGFPINTTFGSNITYDPSFEKWVKLKDGNFNTLSITYVDQNLNTIVSMDANISLTLLIRKNKV